jgi:hypothetical protein
MTDTPKILIAPIGEAESAEYLKPLWGNWIFEQTIVLQVGEPGISKTSFNYQFAKALVDNKPFLGVKPTRPGIKALYLDFESSDALIKSRMQAMGGYPENSNSFLYYNNPEYTLYDIDIAIESGAVGIRGDYPDINPLNIQFDIMFVDTIASAFKMRDENDNAEASVQMRYLRSLCQKYKCSIVLVHHSGKSELGGTQKSRGASARAGAVDVCMNFEKLVDTGGNDIKGKFVLKIPKNRIIDDEFEAYIEKVPEGRQFKVIHPPKGAKRASEIEEAYMSPMDNYNSQDKVKAVLSPYKAKSPHDILEELGNTISRVTVMRALTSLIALGYVEYTDLGHYRLITRTPSKIDKVDNFGSTLQT